MNQVRPRSSSLSLMDNWNLLVVVGP
uniref:Uncharacterized protein n=1 Tax=Tetranychus urticae TaxID=32264 RepID=T1KNE8_TETUR